MARKKPVKARKSVLSAALVFSVVVFVFSLATSKVFASIAVVSPSNMNGWAFDVQSPDGFGTFVTGPATPPLGVGSARLFTGTNGNAAIALYNLSYSGAKLSDITRLEYSTYSQSNASTPSLYPLLIIKVNTGSGSDVLTFDPYVQAAHGGQAAALSQWQTWNAKDGFWISNAYGSFAGGSLSEYVAWVELFNPGGTITITDTNDPDGGIRMKTSTSSQTDVFDEYVDGFTIGVNGGDLTYDFEPDVALTPTPSVTPAPSPSPGTSPTTMDQCKNGGWNTFVNPTFKNQGDCVSFVNK